jgi:hypothetical protein
MAIPGQDGVEVLPFDDAEEFLSIPGDSGH